MTDPLLKGDPAGSRWEKIPTVLFPDPEAAARAAAAEIAALIRRREAAGERTVLGLATGSTPIGVYRELVRLHKEEGLSFRHVTTFNLDEYYPMAPQAVQSYRRFMEEHLFSRIDIPRAQTHVPDGTLAGGDVAAHCAAYERAIAEAGGIDLQLLGIGRTGHVGFNEPGSLRRSVTRLITLDPVTRRDAAPAFAGEQAVPRRAITMGLRTILGARRILLLAFGTHKAAVVRAAVEGDVSPALPASFLQEHENAVAVLDTEAAAELSRVKTPWLAGALADLGLSWDFPTLRRAVLWLAGQRKKPILKLTDEDYNEGGLQELLAEHGSAYEINLHVFRAQQRTITGWPGGKPNRENEVFPKRVLVFSPRPDDAAAAMGGTLSRLVTQGHEVHIAYQTSGSLGVSDTAARRFVDTAQEAAPGPAWDAFRQALDGKKDETDSPQVLALKALLRRGEARAEARFTGLPEDRLHFLNLPFYETGTVNKQPLGEADVAPLAALLSQLQPHQVYLSGGLADPHGTCRLSFEALRRAWERVRGEAWMEKAALWLYGGSGRVWEAHEIDLAVPLSPGELLHKRTALFLHETQRERMLHLEAPPEDSARDVARLYDRLGLAEYEAIETFARWRP
ncbi:MAG: 6-phosphogluconolactonase [Verrucomicrobium sp.]|nr:6-phosphogluconolactonase [Verrucomicrobium sp.]